MITFIHTRSLVEYCEYCLKPQVANKIILKNKKEGLSDTEKLTQDLAKGKDISIVTAIWSERNRHVRLQWLRNHKDEMHAIVLFELAVAEFTSLSTVKTVIEISLPLIKSGCLRVA